MLYCRHTRVSESWMQREGGMNTIHTTAADQTKEVSSLNWKESSQDFVVALDFGGTKIDVAIADIHGYLMGQRRLDTIAQQGAEQAIDRALAAALDLMGQAATMTGGRCLAAGVVSPGIILADRVLLAPNVPGWEQLALLERVRAGLGLSHVLAGNDVKAAAAAEVRWGSLRGADPAIFVSLGTGIAAALVIGGQVFSGAHNASGEIGYNLRGIASITGKVGVAQGQAPLEEAVGGRAIGERGSRILQREVSAAEVFVSTDERVCVMVDEILAELAVHIANIAIFIDPVRIAVGGGLMSAGDHILSVLNEYLHNAVPFPPEVVPARFVQDAALHGAIALALSAATTDATFPASVHRSG